LSAAILHSQQLIELRLGFAETQRANHFQEAPLALCFGGIQGIEQRNGKALLKLDAIAGHGLELSLYL